MCIGVVRSDSMQELQEWGLQNFIKSQKLCLEAVLMVVWFALFWFFPLEGRTNHWSAIIGSSHSKNYILWEYGGYASEGVKQVAELGSPVKMEEEIRQQVGAF